jgi:hypothetical protein
LIAAPIRNWNHARADNYCRHGGERKMAYEMALSSEQRADCAPKRFLERFD